MGNIDNGMKYVPYAYVLPVESLGTDAVLSIAPYSEPLPNGFGFNPENGGIFGVSREAGVFRIAVYVECAEGAYCANYTLAIEDIAEFPNIEYVDEGYEIIDHIGEIDTSTGVTRRLKTDYDDEVFISKGEFNSFTALWFNGDKLEEDTEKKDYYTEEGSTRITIHSQTFQRYGDGTHTIAAEFRDANGESKKAMQIVTVEYDESSGGNVIVTPGFGSAKNDPSISFNGTTINYTITAGMVKLDISRSKAQELIGKAENGVKVLDFSKLSQVTSVVFGTEAAEAFANTGVSLKIKLKHGEIILDAASLEAVFAISDSSQITVTLEDINKSNLSVERQALVPDGAVVISFSVRAGLERTD